MARVEFVPGWEKRIDSAIHDFMGDLADDVLMDMRANCPVDTGELLADLDSEVVGKDARIGAATVPHAIYVEEGVSPHVITPEAAGALFWPGAAHPVKKVHHLGFFGSHFMRNALFRSRG